MRRVAVLAVLCIAAFAAGWLGGGLSGTFTRHPPPPLLRTPQGTSYAADSVIQKRLAQLAPTGSPEADLLEHLRNEGFRRDWEPFSSRERSAYYDDRFKDPNLICGSMTTIWWTVDAEDRILSVRSSFSDDGCP